MRRPRHKLQISTFPFLAVLLGAMGSLIFLLLVMDRRAKIVARNKVREVQEARLAAASQADEQRRAAWERQRRQLHETLAAQERQLQGQLHVALGTAQRTGQQLQASAATREQLQAQIDTERESLLRQREELRQLPPPSPPSKGGAGGVSAQFAESSKTELARLTRDLLDLEQTLDGLRRLRSQQQPTYSLVPYRGQRGANRMPIYVECTSTGLVFLPDGQRLTGSDLDVPLIRAEVERRHGPLVKAARTDPFRPNPADVEPYVLFLIRPDGIGSYYRGQNALRGYQIDFGYELVDAAWTLDVPSQGEWKAVAQAPVPNRSAVARSQTNIAGALPSNQSSNQPPPAPSAGSGGAPGTTNSGVTLGGPSAIGNFPEKEGSAGPRSPGGGMIGGQSQPTPNLLTNSPQGPPGNAPGILPIAPTDAAFNPSQSGAAPGFAKAAPTFRPAQPTTDSILDGPTPGMKIPGSVAKPGQTASGGGDDAKPPTPEPGNAMNRLGTPSPLASKQPKASPVSLGRVMGNRDFIVTIACYGEGVLLTPGGASFVWNSKADAGQTDEALVRTVTQLVQRRQATVRPGEPPYRAVLRFEVHEQGRRTYHRVFPLFEQMRLPMVREDVEE